MKTKTFFLTLAFGLAFATAQGQIQTTGEPGSPSATTTIDGRQIPNPPQPFAGKASLSKADSKPGWPATIVPPKGAPNVRTATVLGMRAKLTF